MRLKFKFDLLLFILFLAQFKIMHIFNFMKNFYKALKTTKIKYDNTPPYTHVVQIGDPVLRTNSEIVDLQKLQRSLDYKRLIHYLKTILVNDKMLGISANQLGVPLRIMCIQCPDHVLKSRFTQEERLAKQIQPLPLQVWVNPQMKILDYNTNVEKEICGSVLSLEAEVKRYNSVSLIGYDETGAQRKMEAHGYVARIIQHEIDHLNGTIYTDIMNNRTLKCTFWNEINQVNGMVELNYYPKMRAVKKTKF